MDVNGETVTGRIDVDDSLGLNVETRIVGQRVEGQVGEGGQALKLKTVNGNIKISK